ncbi:MAG: HAD-IC family P-type ATPase, partial [Clostridia bacterium]
MKKDTTNLKKKGLDKKVIFSATLQALGKFNPAVQVKNPVMFVVYVGAIITTALFFLSMFGISDEKSWYILAISLILWFTSLFGNFAEAIAEGRGRAQADSLKKARKDVIAKKLKTASLESEYVEVKSVDLKVGDIVLVKVNEQIPMDGEVIVGVASVDESAITGESAPVIRESGGDRSAVTGGTTVTSDYLIIKVTAEAGKSFLDKMISMVECASRKKTPNEIALQIFLTTLTIIFLVVSACLLPFSQFVSDEVGNGGAISLTNAIALLVCLAPTTIGALLSSIGIAGMARLNKANVLATSGRAIEAAGDVDILLLDKTGTITLGNRQASEFLPT